VNHIKRVYEKVYTKQRNPKYCDLFKNKQNGENERFKYFYENNKWLEICGKVGKRNKSAIFGLKIIRASLLRRKTNGLK
jgi:hypothetical protein